MAGAVEGGEGGEGVRERGKGGVREGGRGGREVTCGSVCSMG